MYKSHHLPTAAASTTVAGETTTQHSNSTRTALMLLLTLGAGLALLLIAGNTQGCPCTDSCTTPNSCQEIYNRGCRESGMYTIDPGCGKAFNVWCDLQGGGWTVFQRRMDGSVSFNRSWDSYVDGFGDLNREHWLGLDKIHCLTASKGRAELYVDMYDCDGARKYARYNYFHVEGSSVNYKLHISGYTGTAGDSFTKGHNINGMQFTTRDRDNDRNSGNCAASHDGGGWWYKNCIHCNLNGPYICGAVQRNWVGVLWYTFRGESQSLKYTEMKMRFI